MMFPIIPRKLKITVLSQIVNSICEMLPFNIKGQEHLLRGGIEGKRQRGGKYHPGFFKSHPY